MICLDYILDLYTTLTYYNSEQKKKKQQQQQQNKKQKKKNRRPNYAFRLLTLKPLSIFCLILSTKFKETRY